jgi:hypothetical protein
MVFGSLGHGSGFHGVASRSGHNQRVDRTAAPPFSFEACLENLGVYSFSVAGLPAAVGHPDRWAQNV